MADETQKDVISNEDPVERPYLSRDNPRNDCRSSVKLDSVIDLNVGVTIAIVIVFGE